MRAHPRGQAYVQKPNAPSLNLSGCYVRFNMGTHYFMYVPAQIVSIHGDELQARMRGRACVWRA